MRRLLRFVSVFAVLGVLLVGQLGDAGAQSNALSIIPRRDFTMSPGQTQVDTLSVSNINTSQPLNLKVEAIDFSAEDETGSPGLELDTSKEPTAWSLRPYIKLPEQLALEKGKSTSVPMTITLPDDIGAGSYYSAIKYSATNPSDPNKVNVAASGVTLVFVNVTGNARELLSFQQFGAFVPDSTGEKGTFSGLFVDGQPRVLAYRLKNEGNLAEQPKGSIRVVNMFGKTVATVTNANPKQQLALLGQIRRFDTCIKGEPKTTRTPGGADVTTEVCTDPGFAPGRYTAQLSVLYGQNGSETREITAATSFWYLPWWFLLIVVAVLALVGAGITWVVFKIRGRRDRKTRHK